MLQECPDRDRRSRARERHRRALVDAAAALLDEKGAAGFTVDELADRADVSRRTVFNHFGSVDDIIIAACSEVLGEVVDRLEAHAATSQPTDETVFGEVATALRATDLVGPMSHLTRILGGDGTEPSPRQAVMLLRSFSEVSERLSSVMLRRHPDAEELTTHLLVSSLMSGLVVLHKHWFAATGGKDTVQSRRIWANLLEALLDRTRVGYGQSGGPVALPHDHRNPAPRNGNG